ncbi:MAG: hypothetical protein J6K03_09735 [Oscillospiraceae bacterium]|nr:hypothetical protein [Oscillospiraceae bacterium]
MVSVHILYRKPKGGIFLPATGYIQVRAFSSFAQIPLQDVSITVTAADGTAIAMALTDRSGKITPISLTVPELSASQSPDTGEVPFTTVNLTARLRGYEQITIDDLQVFADTVTIQQLEMIPLSELPAEWSKSENFPTPPQNL